MAKIFRGLAGLGAYQPVFCGKGGSGSPKRTFQSLLDENLQVHKTIITYCFVMIIVVSVQALLKLMAFPFTGIDRKKLPDYAFLGLRRIAFGLSLIGQLDTLGRLS
ncbi:MAG: hypothetical protein ACOYM3_29495 [Terrimicrobiaceae bacterium]